MHHCVHHVAIILNLDRIFFIDIFLLQVTMHTNGLRGYLLRSR
jgi:hypothetical protein